MDIISSEKTIIIFILICILMLFWSLWKKPLITIITKILFGAVIIYIGNYIFPNASVGINCLTLGVCVLLGIPGIVVLYIIRSLF